MAARQEARLAGAPARTDGWSIETQRAPQVGEILQTARERKGVDLVRAERETKIRARHLMALESGDFDALPAPVYARGFLRNYSRYLELDPDEMLSRWRREVDQPRARETVQVVPPPQPITAPRHGLKLTGGLVVALVLSLVVVGFAGYVALQLVRFSQDPDVGLRGPSVRRLAPDATSLVLTGQGGPSSRITATGAGDLMRTTTADTSGAWSLELPVTKGRNDFSIFGTDPETGRDSDPLQVIATVPVTAGDPGSEAATAPSLAAGMASPDVPSVALALLSPADGAKVRGGRVKVEGTSDAGSVRVSFRWLGKRARKRSPPAAAEVKVEDGTFKRTFTLPKGRWQLSVAAAVEGGESVAVTREVRSVLERLEVTVSAVDGFTRFNVLADGEYVDTGRRLSPGESETFRAREELTLSVGNGRAAHVTIDGVDYGAMANQFEARTWLIRKGQKPRVVP